MKEDGTIEELVSHISTDRILDNISWITRYHRMQATPEMLRAAEWAVEEFSRYGLKAQLLRFPIGEWVGGVTGIEGWECESATLEVVEPVKMKLSDWHDNPFGLIQRSAPINGVFEVVEDREDIDPEGKFVLTDDLGIIQKVQRYIEKKVAGIIFYGVGEHSLDLPDARRYLSFWWPKGARKKLSGFVLSYRQGMKLRRMLCDGKKVKVRVVIDSKFYDDTFDVATALIEGETDEEVVLTAHLCHPKGEANDNASGSAVVLEIARVLSALLKESKIKRPGRSIRFLLVPEIMGTNAFYLENPELARRGKIGLNFDMVGANIYLSRGSLVLDRQPVVTPGYASALANRLRQRFTPSVSGWSNLTSLRTVPLNTTPFSDGTDHIVLSDPTFGIPAASMGTWPDIYYHTDHDTIDKLSAETLMVAASTGLTFALMAANPTVENLRCAADSVLLDTLEDVQRIVNTELDRLDRGESSSTRFMAMLKRIAQRAHDDLAVIAAEGFDVAGHESFISRYLTDLIQIYENRFDHNGKFFDKSLYPNDKTPFRKVTGIYWPWNWLREHRPDVINKWMDLQKKTSESGEFMNVPDFAYFWIDGNRDTREIALDIASVYGKPPDPEELKFYLELLADLDFIDFR